LGGKSWGGCHTLHGVVIGLSIVLCGGLGVVLDKVLGLRRVLGRVLGRSLVLGGIDNERLLHLLAVIFIV
jgi:hypothetical protein